MKHWLIKIFSILILISFAGCDPDFFDTSCENCFQDKPTEGLLLIKVSYNGEDPIPITVVKGRSFESGEVFIQDTVNAYETEYWVDVGSKYSVQAEYEIGSKTIRVIDGDKVSVFLDDSSCDETCWRPNDGIADCQIK